MEKKYLVIGSNNFWYGLCDTKREAEELAQHIMQGGRADLENKNPQYEDSFSDPESGHTPETPQECVYVYEAVEVARVSENA